MPLVLILRTQHDTTEKTMKIDSNGSDSCQCDHRLVRCSSLLSYILCIYILQTRDLSRYVLHILFSLMSDNIRKRARVRTRGRMCMRLCDAWPLLLIANSRSWDRWTKKMRTLARAISRSRIRWDRRICRCRSVDVRIHARPASAAASATSTFRYTPERRPYRCRRARWVLATVRSLNEETRTSERSSLFFARGQIFAHLSRN